MEQRSAPEARRLRAHRIAINGRFLDEVRTALNPEHTTGSVSYLTLPEEHHHVRADGEAMILRIPAVTALQLYYDGILLSDRGKPVELAVGGKQLGAYFIESLRRVDPHFDHDHPVLLRLVRMPAPPEKAVAEMQWLSSVVPLRVKPAGMWDPSEQYWGEDGEPIEAWAKRIIAHGPRPMFEMQQVLPGADPDDPKSDPIIQANDLRDRGQVARARRMLQRLIEKDARYLDAHAHLGNLDFSSNPRTALIHYEQGVQIGGLSLGAKFDGVLPWGIIDNRPFLRCMQGYGLCLWRLERFEDAERIFDRLLWLSPSDNLGIRFLLPRVRAREDWSDEE